MASRGEAWEYEARRNPYRKKQEIRCVVLLPLSLFQGSVSFRPTIFRFGMTNRFVKDCRVGRKSCALLAMTKSIGSIENTERKIQSLESVKTFLICCLILTVQDFFDSLKRPRGSDESRGRCCLCGKLCAADFRKLSTEAFGRSFSRTSQPRLSLGASAGLHGRCVRSVFQLSFHATMESPYLIIS